MDWPVVGDRCRDCRVDRCRVVMAAVTDGPIAPHIDPRASRAHQGVATHRRGTGGGQCRKIAGRLCRAWPCRPKAAGEGGEPEEVLHHRLVTIGWVVVFASLTKSVNSRSPSERYQNPHHPPLLALMAS